MKPARRAYGPFFAQIGSRYPGIDAAMLPVGAYAPRWFMQNMHMDPEEAVRVTQDAGARVLVPMHWGTFWLSREPALDRSNAPAPHGRPLGGIARTCGTSR